MFISFAVLQLSCLDRKNDLVHEEVPAEVIEFEIEGQLSSFINLSERNVHVIMPADTDLSKLKVAKFNYTEGARADKTLAVGDILDLSRPMSLELSTYDKYTWTFTSYASVSPGAPVTINGPDPDVELSKDGPQLYNMGFDLWSKHPDDETVDVMYGSDATDEQQKIWSNSGLFVSAAGTPVAMPAYDQLAVPGTGKAALKLVSIDSGDVLVGGNAYTGKDSMWPFLHELTWGAPFSGRPSAMEGYVMYHPETVDHAADPYLKRAGTMDIAHVMVILSDGPLTVNPPEVYVNFTEDESIIAYGKIVFDEEMTEYRRFQINLIYKDTRTPSHVSIVVSASALGDYFTGAAGSVLYADEFAFLYD